MANLLATGVQYGNSTTRTSGKWAVKAIFGYGLATGSTIVAITNLVSNTGVVATDTTTGEDTLFNDMAQSMSDAIGNSASVTPVGLYGNSFFSLSGNVTNNLSDPNAGQSYDDLGDGILVPTGGTGNQIPPYENEDVSQYD